MISQLFRILTPNFKRITSLPKTGLQPLARPYYNHTASISRSFYEQKKIIICPMCNTLFRLCLTSGRSSLGSSGERPYGRRDEILGDFLQTAFANAQCGQNISKAELLQLKPHPFICMINIIFFKVENRKN